MKRIFLYLVLVVLMSFSANAQNDKQISIHTACGIMTVSKTDQGKDMIIMSIACWEDIVSGTKYSNCHLSGFFGRKFCIGIADKKQGHCKNGIGFGCSISDCPYVPDPLPNRVDNENRVCAVTVWKLKDCVKMIFDDNVHWQSLQHFRNNSSY